jgi:NDP-sugar pyrophosphorylase family protein
LNASNRTTGADLYIIAAGNGSRLKAGVPKALVPITDEPCLNSTLQQIGSKFRRVFIATNILSSLQWQSYFLDLGSNYPELAATVVNLPIESGLGDGHATLQAIITAKNLVNASLSRDIVVAWGDVFFPHAESIDELLCLALRGAGMMPAVNETDPYVSLLVDDEMRCMAADFSKLGEHHLHGYHDQSVFRFDLFALERSLTDLHNALWKNGRYLSPNGELSLLYTFHHLYNSNNPVYVYETSFPTLTFNTVDEVIAVQKEISFRWKHQTRVLSDPLSD